MIEQDRLFEKVAEELGIPEDKVRFVIKDFEHSLRTLMREPQEVGEFIMLKNLFRLRLQVTHVKKVIRSGKIREEKLRKLFLTLKRFDL